MSKVCFGDILYIKGRIGWQALKKEEYLSNGDYYLVTGIDITDDHRIKFDQCYYVSKERYEMDNKIQLKVGDIIVTKDGTIGKIGIIDKLDKPATLNSHLFLIRNEAPEILNTKYLFYILKSSVFQKYASNNTTGSNIPAFTQKNISEFQIELPDLNIQEKIANILSNIDEKIISNNEINNNLEELMKTIYQRWFIEFEFPNEEGKPYKSNGGKLVYNKELKREIPENWKVKNLNEVGKFISGYAFSSKCYCKDGKYKLYTIKNVQDGNIISNVDNKINELPKNLPVECILKPEDLIMSLTGNVGRVGLVYENDVLLNQRVLKLEPKNNLCYLYSLCRSDYMKNKCESIASGTSQKNLSPIELGKIRILFPKDVVKNFEIKCKGIIEEIVNNSIENKKLTELKDFLLPLLMNGQINVDDIEI